MQHHRQSLHRWLSATALAALIISGASLSLGAPRADDLEPQSPAAFLPGGMLGIQLGGSWKASKQNSSLQQLTCQPVTEANDFDEVCFFKTSSASRVGGAAIHDGFIVRKDDHVVLVGTGITIKSADDPLAESVVSRFSRRSIRPSSTRAIMSCS